MHPRHQSRSAASCFGKDGGDAGSGDGPTRIPHGCCVGATLVSPSAATRGRDKSRPYIRFAASFALLECPLVETQPNIPVSIRSFRKEDLPACTRLYREGLIGGKIAENDTGLDIDDIDSAYMSNPGSHFW